VLTPPDRDQVERILARLATDAETMHEDPRLRGLFVGLDSPASRITRVVALTPLWTSPQPDLLIAEALALAIRNALALFSTWTDPREVGDDVILPAVMQALVDARPPDTTSDAPALAVGALGEALNAYHGAIALGDVERAREHVRGRIALALAYAVWRLSA
jgi:hypothetical protein